MKKYIKYVLILVAFLVLANPILKAVADSGFDSSYDSGGSWDSGSSWDSSSSSGGGSFMDFLKTIIFMGLVILFVFVYISIKEKWFHRKKTPYWFYLLYIVLCTIIIFIVDILLFKEISAIIMTFLVYFFFRIDGFFNKIKNKKRAKEKAIISENVKIITNDKERAKKLYNDVFNIYKDIQIAWSNNNIEPVRNILSDTLYNQYNMQLLTLINKKQRNVMDDIKFVNATLIDYEENSKEIIYKVKLHVTCKDYIIDTSTNEVLRGDSNKINDYIYSLTFTQKKNITLDHCPNCGEKLQNQESQTCPYCKTEIITESTNLVLTDKKMISQS